MAPTSPTSDPAVEPTVADVDRAEAEGRLLDAVDALQALVRRHPDPDQEARLVRLRHDAAAHLSRTPGRVGWPPRPTDVFDVPVDQLPEVAVDDLDLAALESGIGLHGALVVRGLLDPPRVARFVDGIEQTFAAYDRWVAGAPADETRPWFEFFEARIEGPNQMMPRSYIRDAGGVWFADSPRMMAELMGLLADTGLDRLIGDYFGERPATSVKKCTMRRVPVDAGNVWHQDAAFLGEDLRTVNVWVALTDCGGPDSAVPALDVVPRRFDRLVETGTDGVWFDNFVGAPVAVREAGEAGIQRPVFQAGDALLFDDHLLHATATDPSMTGERYAIEAWLFAPSTIPGDQGPLVV